MTDDEDMFVDDIFKPLFTPNPALMKPAFIGQLYRHVIGTMSSPQADRLWGKAFVTATTHIKVKAPGNTIGGRGPMTRPANLTLEFTLRHSGRVLGRVSYRFQVDGREVQHQWKDMGFLDPFNGITVNTLQTWWQTLGYTITRQPPSAKMQAELAMAMIANLV